MTLLKLNSDIDLSGYRSYTTPNSAFEELDILQSLQEDISIFIFKLDKGNVIVILDKNDYRKNMVEILND